MYQKELTTALDAVEKACALCQLVAKDLIPAHILNKADKSPVTIADFAAQAVISTEIASAFPRDKITGEEDATALNQAVNVFIKEKVLHYCRHINPALTESRVISAIARCNYTGGRGRFWTIDPIDGTKGFLRKEQYAVALALVEDGEVMLGVLGCPNLSAQLESGGGSGCCFYAVKGEGAYQKPIAAADSHRIHTDSFTQASQAVFCQSVETGHTAKGEAATIRELLRISKPPVEMDSQAKYALVATGDASIYLRLPKKDAQGDISAYREKIWDHAAGKIIIEEAGGKVTDIKGAKLEFFHGRELSHNLGVIAASGGIFLEVLNAVKNVYGIE